MIKVQKIAAFQSFITSKTRIFFLQKTTKFHNLENWKKNTLNHLQYVYKHSAKFQRFGLKAAAGVDYPKYVPYIDSFDKKWLSSTTLEKWKKNTSNDIILLHAHLQYVHKHAAKFQWSGLKAVGGADYTK